MIWNIDRCCRPIPGDAIVGYLTRFMGVTVHRKHCGVLAAMPEALFCEATWADHAKTSSHTITVNLALVATHVAGEPANSFEKNNTQFAAKN